MGRNLISTMYADFLAWKSASSSTGVVQYDRYGRASYHSILKLRHPPSMFNKPYNLIV